MVDFTNPPILLAKNIQVKIIQRERASRLPATGSHVLIEVAANVSTARYLSHVPYGDVDKLVKNTASSCASQSVKLSIAQPR